MDWMDWLYFLPKEKIDEIYSSLVLVLILLAIAKVFSENSDWFGI